MGIVVGLDIGTTKVCTIVAEVSSEGRFPTVIGFGWSPCKGLQRGVVVDMDQTVQAIENAARAAQTMAGCSLESAFVGVTGDHINSTNTQAVVAITNPHREITESDRQRVLEAAAQVVLPPNREILHLIPRGYIVDGQRGVHNPVGMCGSRLEAETHVVTAGTTFLQNIKRCVERAGLEVEELVLEPLAAGLAVLTPEERETGVALVDIGGGTTDVALFYEGGLCYSGIIPLGGLHVTRDVYTLFRTAVPEEAERIKIDAGSALAELVPDNDRVSYMEMGTQMVRTIPRRLLAEVIQARMEELLELVHQQLLKANREGKMLAAGVTLTGGGARLPGTVELAKRVLNHLPVRIGSPICELGGLAETVRNPAYSTTVGLMLYGANRLGTPGRNQRNAWQRLKTFLGGIFSRAGD